MENGTNPNNAFHLLVDNLSPKDKAVLIHVVEVHDKFCKQCQKHRQNKSNISTELDNYGVNEPEDKSFCIDVNTAQEIQEQNDKVSKNGDIENNDTKIPDHTSESSEQGSDTPLQMDVELEDQSEKNGCQQQISTDGPNRKGPEESDESEDLHSGKCSAGSSKKMKWSIKVFKIWLIQNGISPDFEYMAIDKILNYLRQMAQTRTKGNGGINHVYSVNKMNMIKFCIIHYLNSDPFNRRVSGAFFKMATNKNNFEMPLEETCNNGESTALELMTTKNNIEMPLEETSNRKELGDVLKMTAIREIETLLEESALKNVLSQTELRKIYASGVFGDGENYSPRSLLYKVWFEISLHFGNFLKRSSWRLLREELKIANDEKGRLFCTFCLNDMYETRWMNAPRIYSTPGNPFCPMKSILLYISHLNPNNEHLFQQPVRFKSAGGEWYTGRNLGKGTLKTMMKVISKKAELNTLYPNICVRDTEHTILNDAGLWSEDEYNRHWKGWMEFDIGPKKVEMFRTLQQFVHGEPVHIDSVSNAGSTIHDLLTSSISDEQVSKVTNEQHTTNIENTGEQTHAHQSFGNSHIINSKQSDSTQMQSINKPIVSNNDLDVRHSAAIVGIDIDGHNSIQSTPPSVSLIESLNPVNHADISSNDHDGNTETDEYNVETRQMAVPFHFDGEHSINSSDTISKPIKGAEVDNCFQHPNSTDSITNLERGFLQAKCKGTTEVKTKPFMKILNTNNSKQTGSMFKRVDKLGVLKPPPGYAWIVPHTPGNNLLLNQIVCSRSENVPVIKVLQIDKHENSDSTSEKKNNRKVVIYDDDSNNRKNLTCNFGKNVSDSKGLYTDKSKNFEPLSEKKNQLKLVISDNDSMKIDHLVSNSSKNIPAMKEAHRAENSNPIIGKEKKHKVVIYDSGSMKVQINLKTTEVQTQSDKENNNPNHDAKTLEPLGNVMYNENKTCRVTPMVRDVIRNANPNDISVSKTRKFVFVNKKGEKTVKTKTNQTDTKECQQIKASNISPEEPTNTSNTQNNVNIIHVDIFKSRNKKSTSTENENIVPTSLSANSNVNSLYINNNLKRVSTQSTSSFCEQLGDKEEFCAEGTAKNISNKNVSQEDKKVSMKYNIDTVTPVISFDAEKNVWIVKNVDELLNRFKHDKTDLGKSTDRMVECYDNSMEQEKGESRLKTKSFETNECFDKNEYFRDVNNSYSRENLQTCNEGNSELENRSEIGNDRSVNEHTDCYTENTGGQHLTCQERDRSGSEEPGTENEWSTNYPEKLNSNAESACNFIISDVKSIAPEYDDIWNTKGDNSPKDKDSCTDDKNSETSEATNQNYPNYSKYMPKFQEHFSNRKAKIAKILEQIQENSRRVDILRAKRNERKDDECTLDRRSTDQTSDVVKQEAVQDNNKIPTTDELDEKAKGQSSKLSKNLQSKTYVFKKRKYNQVSTNNFNKLVSDIDGVSKEVADDYERNDHTDGCKKEKSTSLRLSFRKKEGNKYEIIKAKHTSDQIVYSPLFSKEPQPLINVNNDSLKRKNETGKTINKNPSICDIDNKVGGSEDKSKLNACIGLPFKKRIRTENYTMDDFIDDKSEEGSSTESDCSLSDEPSLLKCVNSPAFNFIDL